MGEQFNLQKYMDKDEYLNAKKSKYIDTKLRSG